MASTSSRSDLLLEALNACGITHGEDCHLRVAFLETRLRALNKGQGAGFKTLGVVLNRAKLKNLSTAIFTGLTTTITSLLAYADHQEHRDRSAGVESCGGCNVSASDVAIVRGLFGDRGCVWNMTIEDLLSG